MAKVIKSLGMILILCSSLKNVYINIWIHFGNLLLIASTMSLPISAPSFVKNCNLIPTDRGRSREFYSQPLLLYIAKVFYPKPSESMTLTMAMVNKPGKHSRRYSILFKSIHDSQKKARVLDSLVVLESNLIAFREQHSALWVLCTTYSSLWYTFCLVSSWKVPFLYILKAGNFINQGAAAAGGALEQAKLPNQDYTLRQNTSWTILSLSALFLLSSFGNLSVELFDQYLK